jgi:hypothetical protein
VLQLQAELDKYKAQNPVEGRDAVSLMLYIYVVNSRIFRTNGQNGTVIGPNGTR